MRSVRSAILVAPAGWRRQCRVDISVKALPGLFIGHRLILEVVCHAVNVEVVCNPCDEFAERDPLVFLPEAFSPVRTMTPIAEVDAFEVMETFSESNRDRARAQRPNAVLTPQGTFAFVA